MSRKLLCELYGLEKTKAKTQKISPVDLKRLILKEYRQALNEQDPPHSAVDSGGKSLSNGDHHWPRVEWNDASDLVDKWHDMEMKAFDPGDPSMNPDDGNLTDNKDFWREQVDSASYDLDNELVIRIRKVALQTMKEISEKLINGEYS